MQSMNRQAPEYTERRRHDSSIRNLPDWAIQQLLTSVREDLKFLQENMRRERQTIQRLQKRKTRLLGEMRRRRQA